MSADPDTPVDATRLSGGRAIQNMIYEHKGQGQVEVYTGWKTISENHELDQDTIKPYDARIPKTHPCYLENVALGDCAATCPPRELLAARIARCNDERKAMMKCMTKHKQYHQEWKQSFLLEEEKKKNRPWWQFW